MYPFGMRSFYEEMASDLIAEANTFPEHSYSRNAYEECASELLSIANAQGD